MECVVSLPTLGPNSDQRIRTSVTGAEQVVLTLLVPELRHVIDAAALGMFRTVHVESLEEVASVTRRFSACVLLLSPDAVRHVSLQELRRSTAKLPGVRIIAVLGMNWNTCHEELLHVGAAGVREVANLAEREGWNRLRELITASENSLVPEILSRILDRLERAKPELLNFLGTLVRDAPRLRTVRDLSGELHVHPSTLMSRFFRARLPGPKLYLAMMRLVYAASYLEASQVSIADVAYRLSFSSPQSFGRHVRLLLGLTAGEFRKEVSFERSVSHFLERLIVPYERTLITFDPLGPGEVAALLCTA